MSEFTAPSRRDSVVTSYTVDVSNTGHYRNLQYRFYEISYTSHRPVWFPTLKSHTDGSAMCGVNTRWL